MKVELRYIQQRGNSFFFRMSIPDGLRSFYENRREISQTLRTCNPLEAQSMALKLATVYRQQFKDLLAGRVSEGTIQACEDALYNSELMRFGELRVGPQAAPVVAREHEHTLSQVYSELCELGKRVEKTEMERSSTLNLLLEWHGDLPVKDYSRSMLKEFRDKVLCRLPMHMTQRKEFGGKSLRQVLKMKYGKVISTTTVNNRMAHIQGLFGHALRYGYIQTNPLLDLELVVKKDSEEGKTAYTREQLQRLVDGLAKHATKGGDVRHMRFWVPLLGLYSGARLNEICQLCIGDVVCIDGIDCIDINERNKEQTFKHLKNRPSCRRIPVHPDLVELGFLRFVDRRKAKVPESKHANSNLWPSASYQKNKGWRRKISYWFNEVFRPTFLTREEKVNHRAGRKSYCFHSLRHTFIIQAQNQARMNARIEMRLCGHTDSFISEVHARYGNDLHPSILLEELEKLDYELDLSKVEGRY